MSTTDDITISLRIHYKAISLTSHNHILKLAVHYSQLQYEDIQQCVVRPSTASAGTQQTGAYYYTGTRKMPFSCTIFAVEYPSE